MKKAVALLLLGAMFMCGGAMKAQWDDSDLLPVNKATLFVFEGSDWCSNCRRMEKNVLSDTLFTSAMEKAHIAIERVDFPQRAKLDEATIARNDSLAQHFQFDGIFPTVVIARNVDERYSKATYHNETAADFARFILKAAAALYE
jgi:thioredoxin-related protein